MTFARIADVLLRHRSGVAIALFVVSGIAFFGLMRLRFDDQPRGVFRSEDQEFQLLEELFEQFGSDENDCLFLVGGDDLFTSQSIESLRGFIADVKAVDGVADTVSIADSRMVVLSARPRPLLPAKGADEVALRRAAEDARRHPLVAGHLLSDDGKATLVVARLAGKSLGIDQIKPLTDRFKELAAKWRAKSDLDIRLSGLPTIRADIFTSVRTESKLFMVLGGGVAFLIAVLLFRRVSLALITALGASVGCLWILGGLGLVGEKMNVITTVLPVLVTVVGFTDAVHLAIDIKHSRLAGATPFEASRSAIQHLGAACMLTSITTAVGFGSLTMTHVDIIKGFGLACAIGTVLTFIAVVTIVPLAASTRWTKRIEPVLAPKLLRRHKQAALGLIRWVLRWRWSITIGGVLATALLMWCASRLQPDTQLAESMPRRSESFQTLQQIDKKFGGILNAFVMVEWSSEVSSSDVATAIGRAHDICDRHPTVHHPFSLSTLQRAAPGLLFRLIPKDVVARCYRPELRRALVITRIEDRGSNFHSRGFEELREKLSELEKTTPGVSYRLSGSSVVSVRNLTRMISDLASSLGLAAVVIFGVMTLVFRSIRIGMICLIPNSLPLVLTAALLYLVGEPLRITSVIVFCVCLGIAVDDTIHFITRFRRELGADGNVEGALERTFLAVGSALITSTAVLVAGFACVMISEMPHNHLFAWLSCTAIVAALVGDMILLPAMLACFVRPQAER